MKPMLALASLLTVAAPPSSAADGDIDAQFGSGGVAVARFLNGSAYPISSAIAPDGAVFVASKVEEPDGDVLIGVTKFTAQGDIDTTFSFDGHVLTNFGGANAEEHLTSMLIQSDGKILLIGSTQFVASSSHDFALRRLNPNGSVDLPFGGGTGLVRIAFDIGNSQQGGLHDDATSAALLPDERIVVAGSVDNGVVSKDFGVVRLLSNGALDLSFNGSGKRVVSFDLEPGGADIPSGVTTDATGNIFVAGTSSLGNGNYDFSIAKLLPSGMLDLDFDIDGKATVAFDAGGPDEDSAQEIVVQRNGRILVAGTINVETPQSWSYDFGVARLLPDGSLDASFGANHDGKAVIPFNLFDGENGIDWLAGLALQSDGKILISGFAQAELEQTDIAVARLLPSGVLDGGFGSSAGRTHFHLDLGDDALIQTAGRPLLQAGRMILSAGARTPSAIANDGDFGVLRLDNDLIFYDSAE